MKYQVITNEEDYVVSIGINAIETLNTVEIENIGALDIHIGAYKVIDDELVLDEIKLAEIVAEDETKAKEEAKEEEHKNEINEQTLRLAEMFVSMGVNVDDYLDRLDAQLLYTSLMTDTLLDEDVA